MIKFKCEIFNSPCITASGCCFVCNNRELCQSSVKCFNNPTICKQYLPKGDPVYMDIFDYAPTDDSFKQAAKKLSKNELEEIIKVLNPEKDKLKIKYLTELMKGTKKK